MSQIFIKHDSGGSYTGPELKTFANGNFDTWLEGWKYKAETGQTIIINVVNNEKGDCNVSFNDEIIYFRPSLIHTKENRFSD